MTAKAPCTYSNRMRLPGNIQREARDARTETCNLGVVVAFMRRGTQQDDFLVHLFGWFEDPRGPGDIKTPLNAARQRGGSPPTCSRDFRCCISYRDVRD